MKFSITILMCFLFLMAGCSINRTFMQTIDIDVYPNNEQNVILAKELMYYDPRYIAFKVPSFNEKTSKGIKLGYFVRSSDGKPSYRITYDLKVPEVVSNLSKLKSDFDEYIPKLAQSHASKGELFKTLSSSGLAWANTLFNLPASEVITASSTLLQQTITEEQLSQIVTKVSTEFGKPSSTKFVRAQFYDAFSGVPESVSLYYSYEYAESKKLMITVSMHQENGKWVVMGLKFQPMA